MICDDTHAVKDSSQLVACGSLELWSGLFESQALKRDRSRRQNEDTHCNIDGSTSVWLSWFGVSPPEAEASRQRNAIDNCWRYRIWHLVKSTKASTSREEMKGLKPYGSRVEYNRSNGVQEFNPNSNLRISKYFHPYFLSHFIALANIPTW